ncbi:MAG TPA: hypothetical protein VFW89_09010 [Gemmatimonadaceae bacterium]|nr:hypothetical protein [Gemmatimonadaceae bacterium]
MRNFLLLVSAALLSACNPLTGLDFNPDAPPPGPVVIPGGLLTPIISGTWKGESGDVVFAVSFGDAYCDTVCVASGSAVFRRDSTGALIEVGANAQLRRLGHPSLAGTTITIALDSTGANGWQQGNELDGTFSSDSTLDAVLMGPAKQGVGNLMGVDSLRITLTRQ